MEKNGNLEVSHTSYPELVATTYTHLPQHHQPTVTGPTTGHWNGPQYQVQQHSPNTGHQQNSASSNRKRICGLSVFQFIVVVLLAISVTVGAVLGGLFGSGILYRSVNLRPIFLVAIVLVTSAILHLHSVHSLSLIPSRARTRSSGNPSDALSTPSLDDASSTDTTTIEHTRTSTRAATSTQTNSASETGISADYCNNNTQFSITNPADTYLILCSIDWPNYTLRPGTHVLDLEHLDNQPTMVGCLQACSTWDDQGDTTRSCRAVVWNYKYECYLKNQTGERADTFYDYDPKYIQAGVLLT